MNKELIDRVWKYYLPKEFKEEVKKLYTDALDASNSPHEPDDRKWGNYRVALLEKLFGHHNLTSDAEGEEMLMCEKSRVQQQYKRATQLKDDSDPKWELVGNQIERVLIGLFGSKCLPDETVTDCHQLQEPKTAEPKFHVGQKVRFKGKDIGFEITAVEKWDDCHEYKDKLAGWKHSYRESNLEPYTEPKEVTKMKPIESKVSVYLATKEEDEEFRMLLHENGFNWNTGTSLKGSSFWVNNAEESKILYIHPDMTVTHWGNKTPDTLTFTEFKKRYFKFASLC